MKKKKRTERREPVGPPQDWLGLTYLLGLFLFVGLESEEWTHRSAPDLTTHPAHLSHFLILLPAALETLTLRPEGDSDLMVPHQTG